MYNFIKVCLVLVYFSCFIFLYYCRQLSIFLRNLLITYLNSIVVKGLKYFIYSFLLTYINTLTRLLEEIKGEYTSII